MAAVLSDNIEIGFAGPEASIYVYNEGKEDHTQVFAQMTQCDGSFLVGREPEPDFAWEKLKEMCIRDSCEPCLRRRQPRQPRPPV